MTMNAIVHAPFYSFNDTLAVYPVEEVGVLVYMQKHAFFFFWAETKFFSLSLAAFSPLTTTFVPLMRFQ